MASRSGLLRGVDRLHLLVAGLLVAGVVGLTAFAGSLVVAVMTAVGALGGSVSVWVLVGLLVTMLASGVTVAAVAAWLAWLALAKVRELVERTRRRLLYWAYCRARAVEEDSVLGRLLRPTRLFAARSRRDGPLVTELQNRYVAGELDEVGFEHELERLLGDDAMARDRLRREIEVTAADGGADGDDNQGAVGREAQGDVRKESDAPERERERT